MNCKEYLLGDLFDFKYGKLPDKEGFVEDGYPIFTGYRIAGHTKRFLYAEPQIVVVARGVGGTGDVKLSPPFAYITNLSIVLEPKEKVCKHYMVYKLSQENLRSLDSGAAQSQITIDSLRRYKVCLPGFEVQQQISTLIVKFDDLIETNRRRIQLLEEAARRIYTEWFVRLRFLGHERCKVVNGLPEGWRYTDIAEITAYINRGIAPAYSEVEGKAVINQKCIRDFKLDFAQARRCLNQIPEDKLIQLGDVLINSTGTGTLGRVAQVREAPELATVDTHVTIVRPGNGVSPWFFGLQLEAMQSHFEQQGEGATNQTELKRDRIKATGFLLPTQQVMEEFDRTVDPMLNQVITLLRQSEKLQQARDLLLPRLMSGVLRV